MKKIENGVLMDMTAEEIAEINAYKGSDQETQGLMNLARMNRAALLSEADIEILKGEDAGTDVSAWRTYRQALRDITKNDPRNLTWPQKPGG